MNAVKVEILALICFLSLDFEVAMLYSENPVRNALHLPVVFCIRIVCLLMLLWMTPFFSRLVRAVAISLYTRNPNDRGTMKFSPRCSRCSVRGRALRYGVMIFISFLEVMISL